MIFRDRRHAGRFLANKLSHYAGDPDLLVLALPRGGVPIAFEVAKALGAPLDVFLVRKLGFPGHEEAAMGAIASGEVVVLNEGAVRLIPESMVNDVVQRERNELLRREAVYRGGLPEIDASDHVVILIDDGLATGATMRAAAQALRRRHPKRLVAAVPVGAADTCDEFRSEVDEIICGVEPERFYAVGIWYEDFSQTTDEEVQQLLSEAAEWNPTHVDARR